MAYLNSTAGAAREAAAGAELSPLLTALPIAAIANLTAITGGDAPTEAEHNLIVTKVNALLAALRTAGIITP
jgi:hypothetical protein